MNRHLLASTASIASLLILSGCLNAPSKPEDQRLLPIRLGQAGGDHHQNAAIEEGEWVVPSSSDAQQGQSGWIDDPAAGNQLQLPSRFWSEHRLDWVLALSPQTQEASAVRRWIRIFTVTDGSEEALRACWHLVQIHTKASLLADARHWIDQAVEIRPIAAFVLAQAWDQAFRLKDPEGARKLWSQATLDDSDRSEKAALLRQYLFGGLRSLADVGGDNYISTLILDRDDLWIGTWNGSLVRWSLNSDALDILKKPSGSVSPIKNILSTAWFIYAFQEQSLLRYSKVTGSWVTFSYPSDWSGLRIQGVLAIDNQNLWIATLGHGLWRWSDGAWTLIDTGGTGDFINAISGDGKGGLLIGTKDRGLWQWSETGSRPVRCSNVAPPVNITVIEPDESGREWAIGTWGEGTWRFDGDTLIPVSKGKEYVTAVAWSAQGPLWGTLEQGLEWGRQSPLRSLGPSEGLPSGGIGAIKVWQGRWFWATVGQGVAWWSEYENPALLR